MTATLTDTEAAVRDLRAEVTDWCLVEDTPAELALRLSGRRRWPWERDEAGLERNRRCVAFDRLRALPDEWWACRLHMSPEELAAEVLL